MVSGLEVTGDRKEAAKQIKALYELFVTADCTMVEVRAWWGTCRGRGRRKGEGDRQEAAQQIKALYELR